VHRTSGWWSLAALAALLGCNDPNALDAWPAALRIGSPASQNGLTGYAVNLLPAVRLVDADGNGIPGANVTFTVTGGGGSVTGGVATTGSDGVATVGSWSIGAGGNTLTASIPAPFRVDPVQFAATGLGQSYNITLSHLTTISPGRQDMFSSAAARWELAIFGDVTDITVSGVPAGACLGNEPPIDQTIDDLLIFVTLDSIDGPNGILGAAAPCFIRNLGKLPLVGVMIFDTADVALLEGEGLFDEVILHEMGHVLGFGTIWGPVYLGLLAGGGGSDPFFAGAQGRAAFDRIGGTAYTGGLKVPVENIGGPGTADAHWRESVFGNELMTGFLNGGVANPLSIVTVASLGDEAYLVNYAAADPYAHTFSAPPAPRPGAPAAPAAATIALGDDVLRLPIYTVDRTGRVSRVFRP
jgi:hypothetical protein